MNLIQIRKTVVQASGRHDLIMGEYEDNGIDFYINAGMRYLDSLIVDMKELGHFYKYILTGEWSIQIPYSKAIKAVWVSTKGDNRYRLEKKEFSWILNNYLSDLAGSTETGTPLYYSPIVTRIILPKPPGLYAFMDSIDQTSNNYNAIMIVPIPSATTMVDVIGKFYSDPLTKNDSINFWTEMYPGTLVKAACRELDIHNQNKSKVEAWETVIARDINGINNNMVDEESTDIDQMEG